MEEKKREMNPASLANLKPIQLGEVRNPLGINRKAYSAEYYKTSQEPIPEHLRLELNKKLGADVVQPGDTWARANALSQHYEAACNGLTPAARELREAVEGRAAQRIELIGIDGAEHPSFRVIFEDPIEPESSTDELPNRTDPILPGA
jgi:hypothetical protein